MGKLKIIAHRGNWAGVEDMQNTSLAVNLARRAGFGVEIDLRFSEKHGEIFCAHDADKLLDSTKLVTILKNLSGSETPIFFHIKDNAINMLKRLKSLTDSMYKPNFYFFGLSEEEKIEYAKVYTMSKICYELETGVRGTVHEALQSESEIIWFGVNKDINLAENLKDLLISEKKVYLISPEVFGNEVQWGIEHESEIFEGVVTDLPIYYKHKYGTA